ncbi:MAG TPA: SUMF1/EgtB/PvdO family nonheme iron enzyme [Rhodanobacteraceae bacterium]|nr:SUMF1/EgtB/PvdO family nonheme iron enzyme [Rhodanobacteraceae bacterium]
MNIRDAHPVETPDYRLVRRIGASSTASVYAATELSSGRPLAIKIFHRVDAECLASLERQLQANTQLAHPNIVRVRGTGRTRDGRFFYAMPLLRGFETMHPNLLGRPLRIAMMLRELLAGLDDAHYCGVVHGDIKPSNVLFDPQGRALLADFGIARCMAGAGGEPASLQSDLRDVGMLAYALLGGASTARQHEATGSPTSTGRPVPRLPPGAAAWQPWFDKALAESPERQFHSAQAMADALGAIARRGHHGGGGPVAPTPPPRAPAWPWRTALPIAAIVVLLGWTAWDYFGESGVPGDVPAAVSSETTVVPPTVNNETTVVPPAVSIAAPALPMAVAQPATPSPSVGSPVPTPADRVQTLIGAADTLRSQGHLVSPPLENAASKYLAALTLDPGNRAATAGIKATLATLRDRLDKTWRDGRDTTEAAGMLRQGDELAKHADAPSRRSWNRHRRRLARQVGAADARAARAHDTLVLAALQPLAKALHVAARGEPDPTTAAGTAGTPVASTFGKGEHLRDTHGPLLVYIPATGGLAPFAIAQVEVTRADYAVFARATHRPAASCVAAHNPFSRLRHLDWQAPGFPQGGDQPVVCVSWDDADAYAAWLSKTTGEPYRLPTGDQWLRAAQGVPKGDPCKLGNVDDSSRRSRLDDDRWSCSDGAAFTAPVGHYAPSGAGVYDLYGNVSEWVAGGTAGSRVFRGLSWRDGSSHGNPLGLQGTADSDIGYTSVGFRVVRVIDAAHPAPQAR